MTTAFAPANRRGISLTRQAALDVVYLRLVTQHKMRDTPRRGLISGTSQMGYDYSELLTGYGSPFGVILTHWFPNGNKRMCVRGMYQVYYRPDPTEFAMIRDCLGIDFLYALNDAFISSYDQGDGTLADLADALVAVAVSWGLEIPTNDSVLYMRSRRGSD